mgnify:CR=1 FL=1
MKKIATILAVAALAAVVVNPDTSGPYTDSHGNIYHILPQISDFPTVADFDAAIGHEIFTTRDGRKFQIDRPLTPSELATALANQVVNRALQPNPGSFNGIAAVVTINHPVDEEYRGSFVNIPSLKTYVINEMSVADQALYANWGINFVSQSGQKWDSNDNADMGSLLDEAYREHGLRGKDMMVALTADPTSGGAIGIAYIGLPRQLTYKYYSLEGEIIQHEAGHNYTLYHCSDSTCIMYPYLNGNNLGRFHDYYDSTAGQNHYSVFGNQKNRY